ncbi:MAG: NirA family protein [Opitutae bacterium]|nr:NirA family protein [Opitutae bacterium]
MRPEAPVPAAPAGFTAEQKEYLQGFMAGVAASGAFVGRTTNGRLTAHAGESATANLAAPAAEECVCGTPLSELSKPELWKHAENPLDLWEKLCAHAAEDCFPDEADTFRFKYHGLFYVAPAQDSFMLRLRLPAGIVTAPQLHGLAELAAELGNGCAHLTTRANLQLREFRPRDIVAVLTRIQELGLTSRGAGADNIRNITATPTSGFDPGELIDVVPFAKGLHHYILNHRDLYGLPRKFNVAFDSGGRISAAVDTNDIGFFACRVTAESLLNHKSEISNSVPPGVYFRVLLGGITGHQDFARDTGLLIAPSQAVAVAAAMIRVFREHGDRTNRKKARLKYLLERWGVEKFLAETQKKLAFPLVRLPLAACEPRPAVVKHGWLGAHPQVQPGRSYLGVGTPAGRLDAAQLHALAGLASRHGTGELRLTVWQSVLIPHLADTDVSVVAQAVQALGLHTEASCAAGGIVACTGNRGCKYAAADTKAHATALHAALAGRPLVDTPLNIHFTGCPHSCAQHYCGDIGFLGAKLADGAEGYHVVLGGGMDHEQGIAREILRGVRATEVNATVERILAAYSTRRTTGETFAQWSRRHSPDQLKELLSA